MKLYVSGPMSGIEDNNRTAFKEAAEALRSAGYEVVNPAELPDVEGWGWAEYLKRDIPLMLECDGVAVLPGWMDSRGATVESDLARDLGQPRRWVEEWLRMP